MCANRIAVEKRRVLRLGGFAGERREIAVKGLAPSEKITKALLGGGGRADLALSCCGTEAKEQPKGHAMEKARASTVRRGAGGRYKACKTTQRQARVPKAPPFCSATKTHAVYRARGDALRAAKEKASLIWQPVLISVF